MLELMVVVAMIGVASAVVLARSQALGVLCIERPAERPKNDFTSTVYSPE